MGRKPKEVEKKGFFSSLKQETTEGITAIVFIVISIFLLFSAFGKAGNVGRWSFDILEMLFGIGYYLLPMILLILGISFLAQLRHNLATPKIIGSVLFFIAGLGLVELIFKRGGLIGAALSKPLVSLFDFWVSLIFLFAIAIIAVLIVFDASFDVSLIKKIFNKEKPEDEDATDNVKLMSGGKEINEDEEEDEEEEESDNKEEDVATPQEAPAPKKSNGLIFFSRSSVKSTEFAPPPLSLLQTDSGKPGVGDIKANTNIIKRTLNNFGIQVEMDEVSIGPSVTRYALKPAEGVKLSRIVALQNDLALALAAHPLRIEAPIPGKSLVGIEIPNNQKTLVGLGSLLKSDDYQNSDKPLLMSLGKGITGLPMFADMAKMPHMLIAGATGAGKSVTINAVITSLLYRNSPDNLKFILVDPKRVELTPYNKIPHLLTPVITDPKKTILALKWAAQEMSRRYDVLEQNGVRDISSYHKNIFQPALAKNKEGLPESMPYIIIIIDELADIMHAYPRELEAGIVRLAQMSRAVGIHLIISTQRPSVNVITGLIKANIPARVALQVASQIDSRTILDMPGAEKLLGAGDMLFLSGEMSQPRRIQSAFISEEEVKKVVDWLANEYEDHESGDEISFANDNNQQSSAIFESMSDSDSDEDDDLYEEAKQMVISAGKASTSYIQRKLRVGYARAARLIDILEERGVVGPADGSKPREVIGAGGENNSDESYDDEDSHNEENE
ncbi:DNA translocase FtsK 4TM domain-containing protein [Candidatus Nomurabacteria bacterium]|nr:DNA translocase FtsK 4TM domain-containing protein [Candidatus Nomurabacteria bacterium]